MKDLLLWRALGERSPLAEDLVPLLEELVTRPPTDRMPFVGRLLRAVRDERPRVRAAALAGLSGFEGREAQRAVVRGLHDRTPFVAASAVEALAAVSHSDPWRLVHAAFHADPTIRRAAVALGPPKAVRPLLPYLLGDDACIQDVLPMLSEAEPLPGFTLPAILDLLAAGRLTAEVAADLVRRIKPLHLLGRVAAGGLTDVATSTAGSAAGPLEMVGGLLESLRLEETKPSPPFMPKSDRLPEVVDLLGTLPSAATAAGQPDGTLLDNLVRALPEADLATRSGVAVAAAGRLLGHHREAASLVRLLVAAWPAAALWKWLDVHDRRKAVDDFLAIPVDRLATQPYGVLGDEWIAMIAESELLRAADEDVIDVRSLAGVARLLGLEALESVLDHFRVDYLVTGLRQPRAAPFLAVPGSADRRFWLVERVRGDERPLWPKRLAHLVPFFNQELLPLLEDFTPAQTLELLMLLQRLDPPAFMKDPRGRRLQGVAADLGRLLSGMPLSAAHTGVKVVGSSPKPGEFSLEAGSHVVAGRTATPRPPEHLGSLLGEFVRQWRDGPRVPKIDAFLRHVLVAAIDALPEEKASRRLQSLDAESLRFLLFEQFADDAIPSKLHADLRDALTDRERQPAKTLAATLAAAGGIVGRFNRVWASLLGRDSRATTPPDPSLAEEPPAVPPTVKAIRTLTVVERCRLTDTHAAQILRILRGYANLPTLGLAECLARRPLPQPRGADAAAAILMCNDPLPTIDRALATFGPMVPSVIADRLDADLASRRPGHERLTLHLHAWLWRWERHLEQAIAILADNDRPLAAVVTATRDLSWRPLAVRMLEFVRAALELYGFRDMNAFHLHATKRLADATIAALTGPAGPTAAAVLITWRHRDPHSVILAQARVAVVSMIVDLPRDVRGVLEPWVSSRGLDDDSATAMTALQEEFEACLSRASPPARRDIDRAIECVVAEEGPSWFMSDDWDRLVAAGIDERTLARRLAVARQPRAYVIALETLLTEPAPDTSDLAAVEAFLEQGDSRLADLRLSAARVLMEHGNHVGLPLLLADETRDEPRMPRLFVGLDAAEAADAVRSGAATYGIRESVLCDLLLQPEVSPDARAAGLQILLVEGVSDTARDRIVPDVARSRIGTERIRRVAETFAWGIRRGLELTGKLFSVEMITGEHLGYTRLNESRVFVNPLPILRGEHRGEDVVRGLVVHELGHHVYHADKENMESADEAHKAGIFRLLNLVQDEHLERNLRAIDPGMGDPLKRLAAYAFQHAPREIPVAELLASLESEAFAVLTNVRLAVARQDGHVVVQTGRVLRQLEGRGRAFPRFVRSLRMGLGGRGADPKTAEALALFGPGFRHSSGGRLLEIARELQRIFGDEVRLLDLLGGLSSPISGEAGDAIRAGEGITDREIQQEVERVLAPPGNSGGGSGRGRSGRRRLQINVSPDEEFASISTVTPVPFDPVKSGDYRRRVARPAAKLRQFFSRLGFAHQLDRQRLQGRLLDRGRLLALAIRGEPRVMVSRRLVPSTDLFLGVAVDCSGSMEDDDSIEKARLFAELLAESVRGCRGVDFRVCGFTDSTILDAGSAARCAAHNLQVGGGNNDAAGLWHLAGQAFESRRRAKLLVMISDGLPTECSVAALRKLVQVLSHRHGMCCAQIAVRPLEEACFPIHVLLDHDDLAGAVAAFGKTVMRLVRRAIGAGG